MFDLLKHTNRLKTLSEELQALAERLPEARSAAEDAKVLAEELDATEVPDGEIDWRAIPQIQADLALLQGHRDGTVETPANVGEMFYEADKEYLLRVKVVDVDLAQVVLTRMFAQHQRIPGMVIQELIFDPDAHARSKVADHLQAIVDDLRNNPQ